MEAKGLPVIYWLYSNNKRGHHEIRIQGSLSFIEGGEKGPKEQFKIDGRDEIYSSLGALYDTVPGMH